MKITYETRGGKTYAYTCRSDRMPGKKNPVSKKVYLGRVDDLTGEIIPKRTNGTESLDILSDGVTVKDYGDVLLLKSVADREGISDDLQKAFGPDWRKVLAVAIALVTKPMPSDRLDVVQGTSALCEIMGLDEGFLSGSEVKSTVNGITSEQMQGYFKLREEKGTDRMFIHGRPVNLFSPKHVGSLPTMEGRIREPLTDIALIVMDRNGRPAGFSAIGGTESRYDKLEEAMAKVTAHGHLCTFIADRSLMRVLEPTEMFLEGIDFIAEFTFDTEQYKAMLPAFSEWKSEHMATIGGIDYYLQEKQAEFNPKTRMWVPVEKPSRVEDVMMWAFLFYRPDRSVKEIDIFKNRIKTVKERLDGLTTDDPGGTFARETKGLERYLRWSVGPNGCMNIHVNRNEVREFEKRARSILILASSACWRTVRDSMIARTNLMESLETLGRGSTWPLYYASDDECVDGHYFIRLLAIQLIDSIRRTLETAGKTAPVREVLDVASTYKLVTCGDTTVRSRKGRAVASIFKLFDVEDTYRPR